MKWTRLFLAAALTLGLCAVPTTEAQAGPTNYAGKKPKKQDDGPTKRDLVIKEYDWDGNKRLEKKEMKAFKEAHPVMFEQLMSFCEKAKEKPAKFGVKYPRDMKPKKVKCKKKKVYWAYLSAWAERGADAQSPKHPQHP